MDSMKPVQITAIAGIFALAGMTAMADENSQGFGFWGAAGTVDDIAIDMLNPATHLFMAANEVSQRTLQGSLPGADSQENLVYALRLNWPVLLSSGKTLAFNVELPFNLDQPTYLVDGSMNNTEFIEWRLRQDAETIRRDGTFFDVHDHLYDINYDITWGGVSDSGFISMYGVAGVIPASQDGSVERDAWMLGPEVVFGQIADWGIFGVRASHMWQVASASDRLKQYDHQMSTLKLFFAYGLGNGWHVISNPVIEYDWEAASDNKLALPLGGGVSKTMRFGRIPVKFEVEFQHYLESADALGPDWTLRFGITPVLSDRSR